MTRTLKKTLCLAGLCLLAAAMLCIGAFAAEKTVYISGSGNDLSSGTTYTAPVKTFEKAYALLENQGGTIVVCGTVTTDAAYVMPKNSGTVIITASNGTQYFPLGKISFNQSITFSGDTILDKVTISSSSAAVIACGGNNMILGKNLRTTGDIILVGGYNVTSKMTVEDASISDNYFITINGGKFVCFRGGNRRADGAAPFGTISGNCTAVINSGLFTYLDTKPNLSAICGMNNQTGNSTLVINGGVFYGSLYAVGRAGTNETTQKPFVSGNISITVNGGQINGAKFNVTQDTSIDFSGVYTLNLNSCNMPHIQEIKGNAKATANVAAAVKNLTEGTVISEFTNPLRVGADPWVIYKDGYYYMTTVSGNSINCYKSATLDGLAYVSPAAIWTVPTTVNDSNRMYTKSIWSPELHYVEASEFGAEYEGWWLYFSASDGENVNHRLFCVRALTDDATGKYGSPVTGEFNIPVKMVVDNDTTWSIGQSLLRANGKTYLMWTSETGRGTADFKQNNSIALLKNPYEVASETTIFNQSDYAWEKHGAAYNATTGASYPEVVEGATAVYGDNGEIIVTYTGSGYWTSYYALGKLVLKAGADPLSKDSWIKDPLPMFQHQNGIFGPGHAAFTTDAAGNRWMIYHAYLDAAKTTRYIFIQPYTLSGTTFDMNGGPYSADTVLSIVDKQTNITSAISGFAKVK